MRRGAGIEDPNDITSASNNLVADNFWEVFEASATRFADHAAVEIQRRESVDRFTYADLRAMALERASWLAGRGIAPGDRCAILADNDAHWCAAYLGILRLGAVAVPLDTNYSAKQVATIVRDSGSKILFVNARLAAVAHEALAGLQVQAHDVHAVPPAPLAPTPLAPEAPYAPFAPSSTAVILYTSGTTSDPKGVVLTHANLLAERDAAFSVIKVTNRDAVLGVLPLFHSLAQLANLLLPFAVGARVVYLESVNSTELLRALSERGITIFACVPQFFYLIHQRVTQQVKKSGLVTRLVFAFLMAASFRLRRMGLNIGKTVFARVHAVMGRNMRLFVTGGSKFDPAIGRDLYSFGFTIIQAYGLTETSGAATMNTPDEAHIDTVGRALPGVQIQIRVPETADVDPSMAEDGPSGQSGEIAIRGAIVTPGYFNRPDATAAVMSDGWFLTGDLGRMDATGRITITGRKKDMIVLASGKNIYPDEIEAHYRQSAFIKELCVMGLSSPDRPMTERLHAVVVPNMELMREKKIVNAGDILRFEIEGLAVGLPSHKRVLSYDVWFDPLPRTTTGKVKRHEAERLVRERQRSSAQDANAPLPGEDQAWLQDPHAAAAAVVMRARLRAGARVRPDANLELDLGLDSMERVELLTELEQRFQVQVPKAAASEIFTVRQLVEAVRPSEDRMDEPKGSSLPAADESWSVLLRDLPPETDPILSGLLERKPLATPLLFLALRVLRVVVGRVDVSGLETLPASGPFIISPNHQSYLDPLFVCGALPYRVFRHLFFVGAVEYFETPFTRWLARTFNLVPVDADSNLVPAMKAGAFGLKHGKILILFPEGERSIDGTVRKFKKGSPILARHLEVPIVPVALKGIYELWPRNRAINWSRLWPWSGHRITVAFGQPMTFGDDEGYGEAASRLRERVEQMWQGK
jgi:long-chain acyl-CoA synthetase